LSGVVSGSGALSKSGAGTLILAGNNTFTGGLAINAGMVQLGNSGALNATTPNPVHFGPGSTGILNLGGSGNVTISSLQSNSLPGAPIVENANSAPGQISTLTVNDSGTDTFAGIMRDDPAGRGVLAIAKSGSGTLVLTGANTYTGGTTINAGTLQLGDGTTSNGSVAGNISDNSGLVFANPNPQVFSGTIFGFGSVTKSAPGALTLGGNNSFTGGLTVQEGTLVINTINNAHAVGSLGANANVTFASSGQTATLEYTAARRPQKAVQLTTAAASKLTPAATLPLRHLTAAET
jgi:autotransporter-associated beta strand protein